MVQLTVTQSDTVHADEAHDRTQGTEAPDSTLDATAKLPSAADRRSPRAVHTRGLRRCPAAFGGRGGEGRKRREARGRSLYLNHKCLPPSHRLKCCGLGIPGGLNTDTQTHTDTQRQTDTQRHTQTHTQTETDTQTHRHTDTHTHTHCISFLLRSPLLHRPSPARRRTAALGSAESWCPGLASEGEVL